MPKLKYPPQTDIKRDIVAAECGGLCIGPIKIHPPGIMFFGKELTDHLASAFT